jgi:hypothetical protein
LERSQFDGDPVSGAAGRAVRRGMRGLNAALGAGLCEERPEQIEEGSSLEGLCDDAVGSAAGGAGGVDGFVGAGRQNDAGPFVNGMVLDELTEVVAGAEGHIDVGQDDIGIEVGDADHGALAVGDADDFEPFVAKNRLAHALGVLAVVGEKDPVHRGGNRGHISL